MKKAISLLTILLTLFTSNENPLFCEEGEIASQWDYQNYNHGYCPTCEKCGCNPCSCCSAPSSETCDQLPQPTPPPCSNKEDCDDDCEDKPCAASACGSECGISICALGIAVAALAAAAAIIISSGNGHVVHGP